MPNLVGLWSNHTNVINGDPPEKKLTPRVPPFTVTQGHLNRQGSIGYL